MAPSARAGKKFEAEVGQACEKSWRAWSHNSNDGVPACDRLAAIPVTAPDHYPHLNGNPALRTVLRTPPFALACILECKECGSASFNIANNLKSNHRLKMDSFPACGLRVVLIKWTASSLFPISSRNQARYFAMHWADWIEEEARIGFLALREVGVIRRRVGTASFSLLDGERPAKMIEIFRVQRKDPWGGNLGWTLDLAPLLPAGLELA